ncbi:MAG: hypothetical protein QM760_08670 [Nibricoccus sp.]
MKLNRMYKIYQNRAVALSLTIGLAGAGFLTAQTNVTYTISTVAGNNTSGYSGDAGAATSAQLAGPYAIALDGNGNLYITDQFNFRIRQVSSAGTINTVAGKGTSGFAGDAAKATDAQIASTVGIVSDATGNFYISDTGNNRIRKVTSAGIISTFAGNGNSGLSGDGAAATDATLTQPTGLALDASGNLWIADSANFVIRMIGSDGKINRIIGSGAPGFLGDGGQAQYANLNGPRGVAVDSNGNVYFSDTENQRIRMMAKNGIVTTIAGTGIAGFSGDGGPATAARLNRPLGIAVDKVGNVYFADYFNSRIRKIGLDGVIRTIAGNGSPSYYGDGGAATSAALHFPSGVAVDANGNVYVADVQNNVIRLLTPASAPVGNGAPAVKAGGVVTASNFGASPSIGPGSWIEIYGTNLAASNREWTLADFRGTIAPVALDRTSVTIGGIAAFVRYVSPGQINVQVPSNVPTGTQQLVVTTASGISANYAVTVNASQPGLFAPSSFLISGRQYAGALFTDGAYALPAGAVVGVTSRPAKPGDVLTFYGIGFGTTTPPYVAGDIPQFNANLAQSFQYQLRPDVRERYVRRIDQGERRPLPVQQRIRAERRGAEHRCAGDVLARRRTQPADRVRRGRQLIDRTQPVPSEPHVGRKLVALELCFRRPSDGMRLFRYFEIFARRAKCEQQIVMQVKWLALSRRNPMDIHADEQRIVFG